jgi:hypothetical protein
MMLELANSTRHLYTTRAHITKPLGKPIKCFVFLTSRIFYACVRIGQFRRFPSRVKGPRGQYRNCIINWYLFLVSKV